MDLTGLPANGGFYFQAFDRSVALPVAGYNYNSVWTPLLAGLSPAGMAASVAALVPAVLLLLPLQQAKLARGAENKEHTMCAHLSHIGGVRPSLP